MLIASFSSSRSMHFVAAVLAAGAILAHIMIPAMAAVLPRDFRHDMSASFGGLRVNQAGPLCDTNVSGRRDCGQLGTTQESCSQNSCCWDPVSTPNTPWCFHPNSLSPADDACPVSDSDKLDCAFLGVNQQSCQSLDCCWSVSSTPGVPWCHYPLFGSNNGGNDPSEMVCPSTDNQKSDCGVIGTTQQSCEAKGCCWFPAASGSEAPWCFYKAPVNGTFDRPTKEGWKKRSIYFALTDRFAKSENPASDIRCQQLGKYCGGTFKGMEKNLDYISGMGFDAIWITPVVANSANGYHGYYATNIYEINPNLGTAQDLRDLVDACHKRNIWVMLDVAANHMGQGDIRTFTPFNSLDHYHEACEINYNDQYSIEQCRLGDLPDLNTENPWIVQKLNEWIKNIVADYGFDGIRIDAARHVRKTFWPGFVHNAGVFSTGEIYNGDAKYQADYMNNGRLDSILNFPMHFTLVDVFGSKRDDMRKIEYRRQEYTAYSDPRTLINFLDNHDTDRILSIAKDISLVKNALTYIMMSDGIPCVYYGTEQEYVGVGDPNNRESLWPLFSTTTTLYQLLAKLNGVRRQLGDDFFSSSHVQIYTEANYHIFRRGRMLVIVNNMGSDGGMDKTIPTSAVPAGDYMDIFSNGKATSTGSSLYFGIRGGEPQVLLRN